jgi:hypothetical protein
MQVPASMREPGLLQRTGALRRWWTTGLDSSVRFEVFMAVTMNNGVPWDVTLCGSFKNPTFRRNLAPPSSGWQNRFTDSCLPDMELLSSSETSDLTIPTQRGILEDAILRFLGFPAWIPDCALTYTERLPTREYYVWPSPQFVMFPRLMLMK